MSRVYKYNQITLGEERLIKLPTNQIIKIDNNHNLDKTSTAEKDIENNKIAEDTIKEARVKANELLEAAKIEYDEIINKANYEKETIISEAYTESNQILENAREEGYKQGLVEGRESGLKEMDSLIEEAKGIKQNILKEKKTVAKELESQIINLVISCVNKIIDHEIDKDNSILLNLVEKGIEKCTYTDSIIIRVGVNDYEVVNSAKNKIFMMTEGIDDIEVKSDPALKDGSIIIETVSGTVDASLETQMKQIEQIFHDILKGDI